ncbi:RNA methyltransferase [Nitrosococcus oceani]|uniref:tRNA (cytidine/uridine-2'-O-)-methyltransferase TrmJ n=2 Tax=Nitrosococcus oceani TaxID=1229 RepID=Q3JAM8_NITOC|nr:RNA methyltransferase [Nitrosococcus oceani]KFI19449.1 RNA methyltransferase [Nitrosococcus oceani C-27]ABA58118.1 RNA methyltransferase TrmH, group 1 [Nitrosococcus oceani ATCC 19707]EDZ67597.1 RNA methyltransferase, TrmH family, group 1 [Nitrosococcus oceani AFC27]KFI22694.1 RNA methyltransferase [Nitrosococcus oceani]GEM21291.1 RNA methyltransferase [Nitrosococcus oceani]
MPLGKVRIVLVETTHPGNIGAAARAMRTMGLCHLYLVNPKRFPCAEATAMASGADKLLAQAKVCTSLAQAITGCQKVFGLSARSRSISWPVLNTRDSGVLVVQEALRGGEVAIVFGRENSGLSNLELDRCNYWVHIPSNPTYSSLNLAAAVQVMAYEVRMASMMDDSRHSAESPSASIGEIEGFFRHLEQTLIKIDFLNSSNPKLLMRRLRCLFFRAHLNVREINILRGILTAVQKKAQIPEAAMKK